MVLGTIKNIKEMTLRILTFSKFNSRYDTKSKPETRSWPEWIEIFSKHKIVPADDTNIDDLESKKDMECYVFGHIPEGKTHSNAQVKDVNALVLDIEGFPDDQIEEALNKINKWEYILYSTYKHDAEYLQIKNPSAVQCTTRLRVVLPLLKKTSKKQFDNIWPAFSFLTNKITDPKTKNVSRLYYIPATFDKDIAYFYHNKGQWISFEDLKDLPTKKKDKKKEVYTVEKLKSTLSFLPENEVTEDGENLKEIKRKILLGEPFAKSGNRHNAILALTMWLATKIKVNRPSTKIVQKLFAPSLEKMAKDDPTSPTTEDVKLCYEGAIGKLESFFKERSDEKENRVRTPQLKGQQPYDDDDLQRIIEAQNLDIDQLNRCWIIQKGASYYFLDHKGAYKGPFTRDEARPAATAVLARAPILLNEPTKKSYRRRTMSELVEEYGQVAQEVVVDLTFPFSKFDFQTLVMAEAARPIRDIEPKFNEEFDKCLRLLATDKYEKLCDWLACVPDLNKLLCALYLGGYPGSLKSGLAFGLARLWHKGPPCEIDRILGDFTEDLVFCPLVLVDEGLPKSWKGINITTKLRSMISSYQRTLSRKYLPPATLVGALRLILSANNEFLLRSTEVLGASDLKAVGQRFLYIEAPEAATSYIEGLNKDIRDAWFDGDGIASHALWLSQNRVVEPGKRFWVEGDVSHMHRMLISGSDYNAMVCQWLVYYLMHPEQIDSQKSALVRIQDGNLLVNDQAIYDYWQIYFPNSRVEPSVYKIGAALRAISGEKIIQLRFKKKRIRYRIIDLKNLFAWAEKSNIGDVETMEVTLGLRDDEDIEITDDLASIRTAPSALSRKIEKMKKAKKGE